MSKPIPLAPQLLEHLESIQYHHNLKQALTKKLQYELNL